MSAATHCARCAEPFAEHESTVTAGDPLHAFPQKMAEIISELATRNGTPLNIMVPQDGEIVVKSLYPITLHTKCVVELAQEIMKFAQIRGVDPASLGFNTIGSILDPGPSESELEAAETQFLDPERIIEEFDKHVIGQEVAKQVLAIAISDHLKRLNMIERDSDDNALIPQKSNVLLVGPSGTGKTELAKLVAKILMVPFASISATELTPTGIKGTDVSEVLKRLIENAGGDAGLASGGIIFIDEIDKIRQAGEVDGVVDSIRGSGVQQTLLKFLEGENFKVSLNPQEGTSVDINTRDILVIMGGAFDGLAETIAKAKSVSSNIGFSANIEMKDFTGVEFPDVLEAEHLIKWGFSKEFAGRIPFITTLKKLTDVDLVRILTEPQEAIVKQFQALCWEDDVKLTFTSEALLAIARAALKKKVGARALRSILEQTLFRTRITLRRKKRENPQLVEVRITEDVVTKNAPAEYVFSEPQKTIIAKATKSAFLQHAPVVIGLGG